MNHERLWALGAIAGLLLLAACGRDRADVVQVYPEGQDRVALTAVGLADHTGFDVLDRFVRASGASDQVMRIYEDLSRLAPDNRLVLLRAAHAALVLEPGENGPRMAAGILERLATLDESNPDDPDVQFVALVLATRNLADSGDADTLVVTAASAPEARRVLQELSPLADAEGWIGPHGVTAADARRMLDAIREALTAFDATASVPEGPSSPSSDASADTK